MKMRWAGLFGMAALLQQHVATAQVQAVAPDPRLAPYSSTKDSVRLPDGRTIHLVCMGEGSPTIILSAGVFDWSTAWSKVQPVVASRTRVCAWDRAGLGLSDPPAKPQMVDATTADLEAALEAADIKGPYVLVGHSVGAYESLLFADRQLSHVAGMVLVDPQYPDEVRIMERLTPASTAFSERMSREYPNPFLALAKRCSEAIRAGDVRRGGLDPDGCLSPQLPASYPPELVAALNQRFASASPATLALGWDTLAAIYSLELLEPNSRMVIKPDRNYGSMPLVVLTAGKANIPPDPPAAVAAEIPIGAAEWRRAHQELAALSTRGTNRVVTDSMHDIPNQDPQAVIGAILEVVDQAPALTP
jgi:pimeloyl-ACP methyl ester carboxylesterase